MPTPLVTSVNVPSPLLRYIASWTGTCPIGPQNTSIPRYAQFFARASGVPARGTVDGEPTM